MQAVVLAGGFGKRLAPLTSEVPKPLLPVGGRPILVRQIEWLRGFGVTDVVLAVGILGPRFYVFFGLVSVEEKFMLCSMAKVFAPGASGGIL